jgi:hypothetical protein
MKQRFKREYLRAPLVTDFLYNDEGNVLKAKASNISEGGILLENLPHVPQTDMVSLLLDLPIYPLFSKMNSTRLLSADNEDLERHILRVKVEIVRSFEAKSDVDAIFVPKIGCRFVKPSVKVLETIYQYVDVCTGNVIFLLSLFENGSKKDVNVIRQVAGFLGYDAEEKLLVLRQKVLHDYQSLEGT